ncbi:hypothetical protein ASC80_05545 [Afipia sp. Root123D2]|uniref:peptidoglycan-binding domain-containing protein n=1 Tax=Afipia sp. Root123D2 TaxID=1736436 RepID=UPI0006F8BABA|nr:peptidoglycan-binding protein [Afipia sp. Root123D2]KQW22804.1 hypothetical protein ASC80_05545 [Afipia sp. Root123D2]
MEPASIRYKNPGAQWPGVRVTKWGSTSFVTLNDGQGNKIAVFPTFVQGAAAQFDLWASNYTGITLKAAIDKWSGHNSPAGWKLLKAQSRWEAGKPIPMSDAEWQLAQTKVFGPATAAQNVTLPTATYSNDVKRVQSDLIALGYHEVGEADGLIGGKTRGAITAFLGDRSVPAAAGISPALTAEIAKSKAEGWSRPVAPKRAYATAKETAPKVEAVKQNAWSRFWSKVLTVPSTAGAAVWCVASNISAANDAASPYVSLVKEYISGVPGWVWLPVIAAVGFAIWRSTNKSEAATVADYQTGRLN